MDTSMTVKDLGRREFLKGSAVSTAALLTVAPTMIGMTGCSTSWLQTVLNDLPILAQMATSVLEIITAATGTGAIDPGAAALIAESTKEAQAAITTAQAVVAAYEASSATTPITKVLAAFEAVDTNLAAILQSAQVKDPVTQTTIAGAVGAAILLIEALEALLPAAPVSARLAKVHANLATKVDMPKPDAIKFLFNVHLSLNGYGANQIL